MPLLRRGTGVFFCIHIQRDFSDACFSFASVPGASQMSAEKVHQPNELWQNNEMLLDYMSVKQSSLSCQSASRHCAHSARPDRVIINKHTRNYEHTTRNYPKRRLNLQTVHACMNALHFRTSLKCLLKYRLSCDSNCIQLCFRH